MAKPVTESLSLFLNRKAMIFNRDLIGRYGPSMEGQLLVKQGEGEPVGGSGALYTDGVRCWWSVHIPKDSDTEPWFDDYALTYPLDDYASDFGMSGWDWEHLVSLWVGFDLDDLTHACGLTPEQLEEVRAALEALPYVELRRSTQGKGIHVYVHVDHIPCVNHVVHAILAKAILAKISADTGRDFSADVDAFGAILFCWSTRASEAKRSYELLKASTQVLTEADLPGWRATVLPPRIRTASVSGDEESSDEFDELCSAFPAVTKDAEHTRILEEYVSRGWPLAWVADKRCYRVHTAGLAEVHDALELKGIFKTVSLGNDKTRPNAYAFLRPNGAFFVMRFQTPTEESCWSINNKKKPYIVYNATPDLRTACLSAGGVMGKGFFTFAHVAQAKEAARTLGLQLPDLEDRSVNFTVEKGLLVVAAEREKKETPEGWAATTRRLSVSFPLPAPNPDDSGATFDHLVRAIRNNDDGIDKDGGYVIRAANGKWCAVSDGRANITLMGVPMSKTDAQIVQGEIGRRPWYEMNEPFADEFLPDRHWNIRGAKLRFAPTEPGPTPMWDRVFDHCGLGLDEAVAADKWCQDHGILSGGDYLRWYVARMVRFPKEKLPYLFFVSEGETGQETGKSTWARAVDLLFARGSVDAKQALTEKFNLPLAGAVFCWLEEAALTHDAYLKIKAWLDSPRMMIRAMRRDGYSIPNYVHMVQSGNKGSNCPFELGDTRVVVVEVLPLDPKDWLDWERDLKIGLETEAPTFLGRLWSIEMPERGVKRLYLPVLATAFKKNLLASARRESEEKEGRQTLLQAILAFANHGNKKWKGTASELIGALGKSNGEWSTVATSFGKQLKSLEEVLLKKKVKVSYERSKTQREVVLEVLA
jgi:hypothetical protein